MKTKKMRTRDQLKAFLNQYQRAAKDLRRMEERRVMGLREARSGEERTAAKRERLAGIALRVLNVIDLLPADSIEKDIVEMRCLDNMMWKEISGVCCRSEAACHMYYNTALDELLENERVRELLDKAESKDTPDSAANEKPEILKDLKARRQLKTYLRQYQKVQRNIRRLEERRRVMEGCRRQRRLMARDAPPETGVMETKRLARIDSERKKLDEIAPRILEVINFLPDDSVTKDIMEMLHLNDMTWKEICGTLHLSRSTCHRYYAEALDTLLGHKRVRELLDAHKFQEGDE